MTGKSSSFRPRVKDLRAWSAWSLHRDRFRLDDDEPPPAPDKPETPIGDIVMRICRRLETDTDFALLRALQDSWAELAGMPLAKHAWPARLERETLTLSVENSVWLSELSRGGGQNLLSRIHSSQGANVVHRMPAGDSEGLRSKIKKLRYQVDAASVRRNCQSPPLAKMKVRVDGPSAGSVSRSNRDA